MSKENKLAESLPGELSALAAIAKALVTPLELPELMDLVVNRIADVIQPAELGILLLWDQLTGVFHPLASFGYDKEILSNLALREGESIVGEVFEAGEGRLLGTTEQVMKDRSGMSPSNQDVLRRALGANGDPLCTLAAPVVVDKKKYGALVLETLQGPLTFSPGDLPFVQIIADLIAVAVDNANLVIQAAAAREDRQVVRMRSELLAVLSHELRLPLTAIQGYTSALLMEDVEWSEEKRDEFLHLIDEECRHMQSMLKDILDSSLVDVDQLAIERQPVNLQSLALDLAAEFRFRSDLHQIIVDFQPDFPILEVDPRWIKQALRNLLDNSIKYSPEGGLTVIRGEIRSDDVIVMVADQGIGISPENQIPLFEKYFRVRTAANLHVSGAGLGLPITRAIVEAHGGRIWVESKVGEGTTIYFSLPKSRIVAVGSV